MKSWKSALVLSLFGILLPIAAYAASYSKQPSLVMELAEAAFQGFLLGILLITAKPRFLNLILVWIVLNIALSYIYRWAALLMVLSTREISISFLALLIAACIIFALLIRWIADNSWIVKRRKDISFLRAILYTIILNFSSFLFGLLLDSMKLFST